MKKLAYVITQSEMGGAQKSILLLCEYLKKQYEITVYSAPGGAFVDELKVLGIKHISVESMVREINLKEDLKAYKFLLKEFKDNNYDIVHCHSSKAGILAREAAHKAKIKNIIYTAHGFVFNEPMSTLKKSIYKFLEKYEARKTNHLICVDSNDVAIAKNMGMNPKDDLVYIPNGIDFNVSDSDKIKNDIFTFGLVANFYETKGHRYLIEAFNEFIQEGYNGRLLLIGDGILRDDMEELSKGNNNIRFMGYRSNGMELMKGFDCFILSSVKEGFPFVILEAIKNKVPIIATKVGAVPNILENGKLGILIDKRDVKALKEAMIAAVKDIETLNHKAELAYISCKEKYSIDNMIKETKNLYS